MTRAKHRTKTSVQTEKQVQAQKQYAIYSMRLDGMRLASATKSLKDDLEVVQTAIKENPMALRFASENMRHDPQNILLAFDRFRAPLSRQEFETFVPEKLRTDTNILSAAILKSPELLELATDDLKNNKSFVRKCVRKYPYALSFASEALKKDKNIVLTAIQGNGCSLQFACDEFRDNEDIALTACFQSQEAFKYMSPRLQESVDIVHHWVRVKQSITDLPKAWRDCKDFLLYAVEINALCYAEATDELKCDKELIFAAIKSFREGNQKVVSRSQSGDIVSNVPAEIRKDPLFAMEIELLVGRHEAIPTATWDLLDTARRNRAKSATK